MALKNDDMANKSGLEIKITKKKVFFVSIWILVLLFFAIQQMRAFGLFVFWFQEVQNEQHNKVPIFEPFVLQEDATLEAIGDILITKECDWLIGWERKLVTIVTSNVNDKKSRKTIRKTWKSIADNSKSIKTFFLVGSLSEDVIMKAIINEENRYHDIIQVNISDTFSNTTILKQLAALNWYIDNCQDVSFMLIIPTGTYVNAMLFVSDDYLALNQSNAMMVTNEDKSWIPILRNTASRKFRNQVLLVSPNKAMQLFEATNEIFPLNITDSGDGVYDKLAMASQVKLVDNLQVAWNQNYDFKKQYNLTKYLNSFPLIGNELNNGAIVALHNFYDKYIYNCSGSLYI